MKQENQTLEAELRSASCAFLLFSLMSNTTCGGTGNTNVEQKARHLEMKVAENADTIDQLRQERSLLAADHRKLQKKYSEVSEVRAARHL